MGVTGSLHILLTGHVTFHQYDNVYKTAGFASYVTKIMTYECGPTPT